MAEKMQGRFTSEFKAQVALAAISNQMTVSEIVEKYNISKATVYQWKEEFLSNASKVFEIDRTTLNPWIEATLMRDGISSYIDYYNKRRCHSSIGHMPPAKLFFGKASKAA